jgi:hypothetical protein
MEKELKDLIIKMSSVEESIQQELEILSNYQSNGLDNIGLTKIIRLLLVQNLRLSEKIKELEGDLKTRF